MEITTAERIRYFNDLFDNLINTTSLTEKRAYIAEIPDYLQEDWKMILECLSGKHKFGYTWKTNSVFPYNEFTTETVKDLLDYLLEPMRTQNLTEANILNHCTKLKRYCLFFQPIVDRTLKLGIGNSLLDKSSYAPMLAKKLEDISYISGSFTVTEKLDGNRCIAFYDGLQWNFVSRNGKPMRVDFDMASFPKDLIYDGEVLSPTQVEMSKNIAKIVQNGLTDYERFDKSLFNETSGLINRHSTDKNLIYNIFDIQAATSYSVRRNILNELQYCYSKNVRILPVLAEFRSFEDVIEKAPEMLDIVTGIGGEGLMLNNDACEYEHKRTKAILKYKKVKTMDMRVMDIEYGTGKYEFAVGALICNAYDAYTGLNITCKVGTGLSDEQRFKWIDKSIIGKIVEVSYFDISDTGLSVKSLRFPRLKRVRDDKVTESVY